MSDSQQPALELLGFLSCPKFAVVSAHRRLRSISTAFSKASPTAPNAYPAVPLTAVRPNSATMSLAVDSIERPGADSLRNGSSEHFTGFDRLETYMSGQEIAGGSGKGVLSRTGIRAWRHKASGVRVVLFHAAGPLTSANIALGTIPVSDAGHPHTLEHIIFLGSRNFPLRGYLDTLANRSLANGTNAYTDVSATVYQASAAGFEGMAALLPVFLDHVLRPKINQKAFASEVYCIRKDGKESGVVFSEMHGRENTEGDLSMRAINRVLLGGTPLAYNSGGICSDIRTLTSEGIQRYHSDYYCGSNVTVIIGGDNIPPPDVLGALKPILDEIAETQNYAGKAISWDSVMNLTPMPPITEKFVKFPCPDEEIGSVVLGWRGPPASDPDARTAIEVLLQYLTSTVSAPMQQKFVESEEPYASQVYFDVDTYVCTSTVILGFSGVSHKEEGADSCTDKGAEDPIVLKKKEVTDSMLTSGKFTKMVMDYLKELSTADELEGGIEAVHVMINREKEGYLSGLEEDSHDMVPTMLIDDVLYSDALQIPIGSEARGKLARLEQLYEKDEQFWLDLMRTALVEAPRLELCMVPDPSLADELAAKDQKLTEERIATIGLEELKRQGEINEKFIASLTSASFKANDFPSLPSASKIPRIPYKVSLEASPDYWQQSVAVDTDFVHATIFLDTSTLSFAQRLILPLVSRLLFHSDIALEDGSYISYQDSAYAISEVTVPTDISGVFLGYNSGAVGQCLGKHYTATPEKFEEATKLILQAFFQEEVTKKRMVTVAKNIVSDITEDYRDPVTMMKAASTILCAIGKGRSTKTDIGALPNHVLDSTIGARPLLNLVAGDEHSVKTERARQKVLKLVNETLTVLRTLPSSSVFIQICGQNSSEPMQSQFRSIWRSMRSTTLEKAGKSLVPLDSSFKGSGLFPKLPLSRVIREGGIGDVASGKDLAKVIGIPGVENCYIDIRVASNLYPGHEEWPATTVLTEMLCRMEGPLSDAIRGSGLAYGYGISNSQWRGYMRASIAETSSPVSAWLAMADKIFEMREELRNPDCESTLLMDLDTAKAMTLYGLSCSRSTPEWIVRGGIYDSALGIRSGPEVDKTLDEAVENVTLADILRVFEAYVIPLFREGSRVAVLTCSPHMTTELSEAFQTCKYGIRFESCAGDDLVPKAVLDFVKKM